MYGSHYILGRDTSERGGEFLNDLRNGELSRDLNTYRGFEPATSVSAEGLASPSWGGTLKFREIGNTFHGVYIGGGPSLSMQDIGHARSGACRHLREPHSGLHAEHELSHVE